MRSSTSALFRAKPRTSAALAPLFPYGLVLLIGLYLVLSGTTLLILRWHYVGGGSAIEKIHPATYLLFVAVVTSLVFHSQFRRLFLQRISSDLLLVFFVAAIIFTAGYDVLFGNAPFAPFVDTFLAAVLTTIVLTCVPYSAILLLRRLVDLFFVFNIFLIFVEYVLHVDFIAPYVAGVIRTPEEFAVLGGQGGNFGRLAALFGHPLNAAMLFAVYSIANLVSVPMRISTAALVRLGLSALSYLAIFPTESRASMVATTLILALYLAYFGLGTVIRGRISPVGVSLTLIVALGVALVAMFLWEAGFFDNMLLRFQYDYGSALSRDYALEILQSISSSALWLGLSQSELNTLQSSFGLIAIEISWVNFILVGGLVTTIPLFLTFCLFLFGSLPRYCSFGIYFVSMLILESTFASNSIWSKTTIITSSLIVAISMLRRDVIRQGHVATTTEAKNPFRNRRPGQSVGQRA
jgi:hypothetical protein